MNSIGAYAASVPTQYAQGWDQTKPLGIARVHVVCDNPFAIRAGRAHYAEPK